MEIIIFNIHNLLINSQRNRNSIHIIIQIARTYLVEESNRIIVFQTLEARIFSIVRQMEVDFRSKTGRNLAIVLKNSVIVILDLEPVFQCLEAVQSHPKMVPYLVNKKHIQRLLEVIFSLINLI